MYSLNTVDRHAVCCFGKGTRPHSVEEGQVWKETETANTLNSFDTGESIGENQCPTITASAGMSGNNQPVLCQAVDCRNATCSEINNALQASSDHTNNANNVVLCVRERCGCEGGGKGLLIQDDKSGTVATSNDQFLCLNDQGGCDERDER